jgi:type VI secretion system protein ImpK
MIATHNQQTSDDFSRQVAPDATAHSSPDNDTAIDTAVGKVKNLNNLNLTSPLLLPGRTVSHHPKAGLNPLVDATAYLFSVLGKLKHMKSYRQLNKLQKELIQEINTFQENVKHHGFNGEYLIVCRYIICATFDDIIANTSWGGMGQWDSYCLLAAFNQDMHHQDKFFTILERAIKEPTLYIDLMELMYICLSMGYKGHYRSTEHNQYQLEQITNNLYKHIRAYRGSFSKTLSPTPLKAPKSTAKAMQQKNLSLIIIVFATACIVMTIFVSLGYLMDVISNEAYKNITQIETPVSHETSRQ